MVLELTDVHTYYGSSHVLQGVSLNVGKGEVVTLLGRNGAGKTTIMRSIMGLTPPRAGRIRFDGREVMGRPVHAIARMGLGFVPEDRRVYAELTVRENLLAVARAGAGGHHWTADRVFEIFPELVPLRGHRAGQLSGGQQQMLAIGRTLTTNPTLLLLDEPAEGLSPIVVQALARNVAALKREGMTILLSEQNVRFALASSDRVYVVEKGTIKYEGSVEDVRANAEITRRYLMV